MTRAYRVFARLAVALLCLVALPTVTARPVWAQTSAGSRAAAGAGGGAGSRANAGSIAGVGSGALSAVPGASAPAASTQLALPRITLGVERPQNPGQLNTSLQLLLLFTILSIAPALLIMLTSFTRIVVVLSFLRQAMSTQQMPPNQVLISLALFLTFFIMSPVWNQINDQAVQPMLAGHMTQGEAIKVGSVPLREFMLRQTREKDLALFVSLSRRPAPHNASELPMTTVIPAFMISELRTAFQMGFVIYLPFLIVDMVVASVLMSMGMMMLPPAIISLPFKILLFVLVDGWHLIVRSLVLSFR